MGNSFRVIVPGDDAKASELRLGYYMPGDEGIPPNFADAGDVKNTTGVLMTTKGQYALVSGESAFVQVGRGIGWQVAGSSDGWDLKTTDDLTITSKSLYLQSDESVTATSAPEPVSDGQLVIKTEAELHVRSYSDNVQILCENGHFQATMTGGWHEIWGNKVSNSYVSTSITLLNSVSIKIGGMLSVTMYYCAVRGVDTSLAFNSTSAVLFGASATGVELDKEAIASGVEAIGSKVKLLGSSIKAAVVNAVTVDFGDLVIDISQEDIDSDLMGAGSYFNAVPQMVI